MENAKVIIDGFGVIGDGQLFKGETGYFVKIDMDSINKVSNDLKNFIEIDFNSKKLDLIDIEPIEVPGLSDYVPMEIDVETETSNIEFDFSFLNDLFEKPKDKIQPQKRKLEKYLSVRKDKLGMYAPSEKRIKV